MLMIVIGWFGKPSASGSRPPFALTVTPQPDAAPSDAPADAAADPSADGAALSPPPALGAAELPDPVQAATTMATPMTPRSFLRIRDMTPPPPRPRVPRPVSLDAPAGTTGELCGHLRGLRGPEPEQVLQVPPEDACLLGVVDERCALEPADRVDVSHVRREVAAEHDSVDPDEVDEVAQ